MAPPRLPAADQARAAAGLADELARANQALSQVGTGLRYRLENPRSGLLSDRIVAQVHGFLDSLAAQVFAVSGGGEALTGMGLDDPVEALADALGADPLVSNHVHALALEVELTDRLAARLKVDPVLPPLLKRLTASARLEAAAAAVVLRDAQARFGQAGLRSELPLAELPGDILDAALRTRETQLAQASVPPDGTPGRPSVDWRVRGERSDNRLELLRRTVAALRADADAALDVAEAGVALFVTALALGSGLERDVALATTVSGQEVRLVLALVACGLGAGSVRTQFLALHPDAWWPEGLALPDARQAASLLSASSR
jgi:hypothetical protein